MDTNDQVSRLHTKAEGLLTEARRMMDFAATVTDERSRTLIYEAIEDLIVQAATARVTARNLLD